MALTKDLEASVERLAGLKDHIVVCIANGHRDGREN